MQECLALTNRSCLSLPSRHSDVSRALSIMPSVIKRGMRLTLTTRIILPRLKRIWGESWAKLSLMSLAMKTSPLVPTNLRNWSKDAVGWTSVRCTAGQGTSILRQYLPIEFTFGTYLMKLCWRRRPLKRSSIEFLRSWVNCTSSKALTWIRKKLNRIRLIVTNQATTALMITWCLL